MRPPSVDALARDLVDVGLPHPLLVDAARAAIASGDPSSARRRAEEVATALLQSVVNATGVLLHTNLGRAPLGRAASPAAGNRYTNLELDLGTGKRGSRSGHAASLLARACGAEAALVVNNNAAAVLLVLAALARGRSVVVSRGELVEIGGGFRVPEVLEQSGARLVEVGTTNRTRVDDYRRALDSDVALILKVHQSNYRMVGFTQAVEVGDLAPLGPPVVADIGSGLLDADTPWIAGPERPLGAGRTGPERPLGAGRTGPERPLGAGRTGPERPLGAGRTAPPSWLAEEPAARQTLAAGAGLVTFSGDKLLGGPQAGVIAGRAELVAACARHPLSRALRPGGLVLGALQETALAYLRREGDAIPFWRMATESLESLRSRAAAIVATVPAASVCDTVAVAGGGSLPGQELPSVGVRVAGDHSARLRAADPPVIARVRDGSTICDLRTVDPADDTLLAVSLARAVAG